MNIIRGQGLNLIILNRKRFRLELEGRFLFIMEISKLVNNGVFEAYL